MTATTDRASGVVGAAIAALLCLALLPAASDARVAVRTQQRSAAVKDRKTFKLRHVATHVAVYWRQNRRARVLVAFRRAHHRFGHRIRVRLDEIGLGRHNGETYGAIMVARGARQVRVWTNRPLRRLTVVAITDRGGRRKRAFAGIASHLAPPAVISRAGWGADESLRFDSHGNEIWPPTFWPVQKLIVHHTATQNNDPDPAATIRSIYRYHAVTQGWGDIGYNFLIDESGNVYEGRHSREYAPGESPTGDDVVGNGVTAAHAQGYNSGTVGIALLGTLTNRTATDQARQAVERLLAWESERHAIDPQGSALYTNPVTGARSTFPNIAGHRDVLATECPGQAFYDTLPSIRSDVAALVTTSGYPRPKGATPIVISLVPAFEPCSAANSTHGPPLDRPSCSPPTPASDYVTVGTPDTNGNPARMIGHLRIDAVAGNPATSADEADARIDFSVADLRTKSDLSDYAGELSVATELRMTDRGSGNAGDQPATTQDLPLTFDVQCASTPDSLAGATCAVNTSVDALFPGAIVEGRRSVWELGAVKVVDGGPDGLASTGPNGVFAVGGIFVP